MGVADGSFVVEVLLGQVVFFNPADDEVGKVLKALKTRLRTMASTLVGTRLVSRGRKRKRER